MSAGWIIKRNNKENGPFSAQQLKKLAATGKLKREDLIRKEPGGKFMRAQSLKGLFPEEDLEDLGAGDSADFANVDISRFRDLPMEDDEDEDDGPPRKRGSKGGTKTGGRKGGKGKKGRKGKKSKEDDWEDDPVNDLFWGGILVFMAGSAAFYMDPKTWELPPIMVTIHESTGRFGVSAALLLLSLLFFVPAIKKIGRLKERGRPIPWHLPVLGWLFTGLFSGSEESEEE